MTLTLEQKKARRRRTLSGFPIAAYNMSRSEATEYFAHDRLTCLLCGKTYQSLEPHLRVHELRPDEYRERYGLPWRRGLIGQVYRAYRQECERILREKGLFAWDPETQAKAALAVKENGVRRTPYHSAELLARCIGPDPMPHYGLPEEHFAAIERDLKEGKLLEDALKGRMVNSTWFAYLQRNPEVAKRLEPVFVARRAANGERVGLLRRGLRKGDPVPQGLRAKMPVFA